MLETYTKHKVHNMSTIFPIIAPSQTRVLHECMYSQLSRHLWGGASCGPLSTGTEKWQMTSSCCLFLLLCLPCPAAYKVLGNKETKLTNKLYEENNRQVKQESVKKMRSNSQWQGGNFHLKVGGGAKKQRQCW